MKRLSLLFLLVLCGFHVLASDAFPAEKTTLFTQRTIYISGENIDFSGVVSSVSNDNASSHVVYVELISATGQKINQLKTTIQGNVFSGSIAIPEELLSGYFYLRAYTKWMRNGSNDHYASVMLKIFNPYSSDLFSYPDSVVAKQDFSIKKPDSLRLISVSKNKFNTFEKIEFHLNQYAAPRVALASVSLVPAGSQLFFSPPVNMKSTGYKADFYLAETQGPVLSGTILNHSQPAAWHKLNVNILGEKDFISSLTNSRGRFHIELPELYRDNELFIMAAAPENGKVEILLDYDFCQKPVQLLVPPFTLDEEEKVLVLNLARNARVLKAWNADSLQVADSLPGFPFYGMPIKTIDFDFYILLDSLEQYFTDIPSWVQVKRKKGKRYLEIFNEKQDLTLNNPLILVDWIPVDEADRVLALSPALVKKIEVINKPYWHGSELCGGIVSLITRKGDFGNIRFAETGMFLNYRFLSSETAKVEKENPLNYVQWINNLTDFQVSKESILAPALEGIYWILVQYTTIDGQVFYEMEEIEVRNN